MDEETLQYYYEHNLRNRPIRDYRVAILILKRLRKLFGRNIEKPELKVFMHKMLGDAAFRDRR